MLTSQQVADGKKKDFWLASGDTLCVHGLLMGANGDFKFMFMNKQCGCLGEWLVVFTKRHFYF